MKLEAPLNRTKVYFKMKVINGCPLKKSYQPFKYHAFLGDIHQKCSHLSTSATPKCTNNIPN